MPLRSMSLEVAFGSVVRAARVQRELSQEALAARSRLHRTFISQLERGVKSPSLASMQRIATALDVPLDELVAEALRISRAPTSGHKKGADNRRDGNRVGH